ncbi:YwqJ-related putative deaminase [Clostridium beijerinckii]|uniref:Uncharacterized protein n=2 Tax=Clostridium beijerinckii TaxID=1520 RepID=A0A1S8R2K1_CLOBE|nr:YwqJ-related putative deaminase [Clostridium beijerinckii]ABR36483.1 hypothetical protein Cbei_4373 [Clostridium beijerinckii NCIMB 8052]AIU00762.1 hypothetical protein Cbs_4373 [Clostridium beijerinckii ATCC 35702]MBF7808868.1 hypothetical protein [Clostridium beijerinckii]NRT22450.1 hypothetical protein [Clostridium beijerinckii]NRT65037.1 hypothetical protein [Clostridium beijerinckii]
MNNERLNLGSDRTKIYENVRSETQRKIDELTDRVNDKKDSLVKNDIKPALSTSYNVNTDKYYHFTNLTKDQVKNMETVYHPYTKERINKLKMDEDEIFKSYEKFTNGAGTHAECLSLNESMLDEFCIKNHINRE